MVASKQAQVTENSFKISHVEQYNTTIRYLQDTRHLSLRMSKLDRESLHVRAYTDASLSTKSDHSSQLDMLFTVKCDFIVEQWVIRSQNAPTPAKYLSTASICYFCSCITGVIHPSRDTTSSYTRSKQNASSKTVLVEITEGFSTILMEYVRTVSISYTNGTAQ